MNPYLRNSFGLGVIGLGYAAMGWFDWLHLALGGALLALFTLGAWGWRRHRRPEELADDLDEPLPSSPARSILAGMLGGLGALVLMAPVFSFAESRLRIDDADREEFLERIALAQELGRHEEAAELCRARLEQPASREWRLEIARSLGDCLLAAAAGERDLDRAHALLTEAIEVAQTHAYDAAAARARLDDVAEDLRFRGWHADAVAAGRDEEIVAALAPLVENGEPAGHLPLVEWLLAAARRAAERCGDPAAKLTLLERCAALERQHRGDGTTLALLERMQADARQAVERQKSDAEALRAQEGRRTAAEAERKRAEEKRAQEAEIARASEKAVEEERQRAETERKRLEAEHRQEIAAKAAELRQRIESLIAAGAYARAQDELDRAFATPDDVSAAVPLAELLLRCRLAWSDSLVAAGTRDGLQAGLQHLEDAAEEARRRADPVPAAVIERETSITAALQALDAPRALPRGSVGSLAGVDARNAPLVVAKFRVESAAGAPVLGLERKDFRVTVGDRPVGPGSVLWVDRGARRLDVVVAIDTSLSLRGTAFAAAKQAACGFLRCVNPQLVSVQVLGFGDKVYRVTPWTNEPTDCIPEVEALSVGGNTALYAALAQALEALEARAQERRVILFTDGKNTARGPELSSLLARARALKATVDVIGLRTGDLDTETLRRIAQATGGSYVEAAAPEELAQRWKSLSERLSSAYYQLQLDAVDTAALQAAGLAVSIGSEPGIVVRARPADILWSDEGP